MHRIYNEERPHSAIRNITPIMLANSAGETSPPDLGKAENSSPEWSDVGWQELVRSVRQPSLSIKTMRTYGLYGFGSGRQGSSF